MAVSDEYLKKVRFAVRVGSNADIDQELRDIIEECRHDLAGLGVLQSKLLDETDPWVLGAVRSFARWKFGLNNEEAAANREDYMLQRDEMRKRAAYVLE